MERWELGEARAVLGVVAARGAVDQTLVTAEDRELDKAVVVAADHDSVETPTTTAEARELDLAKAVVGVIAARRATQIRSTDETSSPEEPRELDQARAVLGVVAARSTVDETLITAAERKLDQPVVGAADHDPVETPTVTAEVRELDQARAVLGVVAARRAAEETLAAAEIPSSKDHCELDQAPAVVIDVAAQHDSVESPVTTAEVRELDLARAVLGVVAARRAVEETPATANDGELIQEKTVLNVV